MGSGFKVFTNGSVLPDTDLNGYLMQQAVVTCTSGTRPSSPVAGQPIYESDTKLIRVWDGTTWYCPASPDYVAYTPTFYSNTVSATAISGGSVSLSYARYQKVNTRVHCYGHAQINTTTANGFGFSLPFNTSQRIFAMGQVYLHGTMTSPATPDHYGNAITPAISAPYNRVVVTAYTNGSRNIDASGNTVHWNIVYESA